MTEETTNPQLRTPSRPPTRGFQRYTQLRQEVTQHHNRQNLFSIVLTASTTKEEPMSEQQFLIDLVFKPNDSGLRLRPAETQLLLAYIGEILKEVEAEEERMSAEQESSSNGKETTPCK